MKLKCLVLKLTHYHEQRDKQSSYYDLLVRFTRIARVSWQNSSRFPAIIRRRRRKSADIFVPGTFRMNMRTSDVMPAALLRMCAYYTWQIQKIDDPALSVSRSFINRTSLPDTHERVQKSIRFKTKLGIVTLHCDDVTWHRPRGDIFTASAAVGERRKWSARVQPDWWW